MTDKNDTAKAIEKMLDCGEIIALSSNINGYECELSNGTITEGKSVQSAVAEAFEAFEDWRSEN